MPKLYSTSLRQALQLLNSHANVGTGPTSGRLGSAKSNEAPTLDFSVAFVGYTPRSFGAAQKAAYTKALQSAMPGASTPCDSS